VPSLDHLRGAGVDAKSLAEITASPKARQLVEEDIRNLINHRSGFKSFERITSYRLLAKTFDVGDEMTNTFKLKRHVITDRYSHLIAEMFHHENKAG
jgi:long-chain acyl-CoA synthetase